jgi:hypothetical protein
MTHVIQQAKRFLSVAVLITACSAGALRSPPDATALTFTGCALQGGFCDASNTCRRQDFVPERGLVKTVFGRCDERGDFGGPLEGGDPGAGAPTLRFLDSQNQEIAPATNALEVSNFDTQAGLPTPAATQWGTTSPDPKNFRLEYEGPPPVGNAIEVELSVPDLNTATTIMLNKQGRAQGRTTFRSDFLRLVTNPDDDKVAGMQTVLVRAGSTVMAKLRMGQAEPLGIPVCRPASETGPNALRWVSLNIQIGAPPGLPPSWTQKDVEDQIDVANEIWVVSL